MKKEKTRNNGTMTESAFRGMIRSALRQKSRWRKAIAQCKDNNRRKYTGANKRVKREYQCNYCKKWFVEKTGKTSNIQVDHIIECGSLTCANDLPLFVERLFCEVDGLQILCSECHLNKTNLYIKKPNESKTRISKPSNGVNKKSTKLQKSQTDTKDVPGKILKINKPRSSIKSKTGNK